MESSVPLALGRGLLWAERRLQSQPEMLHQAPERVAGNCPHPQIFFWAWRSPEAGLEFETEARHQQFLWLLHSAEKLSVLQG